MEFQNQKKTRLIKMLLIRLPFLLLLAVGVLTLFNVITSYIWLLVCAIFFLVALLSVFILKLHSIHIMDHPGQIEIRFYAFHPLASHHRMIKLDKKQFSGVKLISRLGGLRRELIIEEKVNGKTALYPPISLTLFSAREQTEILNYFKQNLKL